MSWARAVWFEKDGKGEEEEVIPTNWIKDNQVRFPTGLNVLRALKAQDPPQDDWLSFPLLKVKCYNDDKEVCDLFNFTSSEESQTMEIEEKKKKKTQKTINNSCQALTYPSLPGGSKFVVKEVRPVAQPTPPGGVKFSVKEARPKIKNTPHASSKNESDHQQSKTKKSFPGTSTHSSVIGNSSKKYLKTCIKRKLNCDVSNTPTTESTLQDENITSMKGECSKVATSSPILKSSFCSLSSITEGDETIASSKSLKKKKLKKKKRTVEEVIDMDINDASVESNSKSQEEGNDLRQDSQGRGSKERVSSSDGKKNQFPLSTSRYQYKSLHILTEIRDNVRQIVSLLQKDSLSLNLTQFDKFVDFKQFDDSLAVDQDLAKNLRLRLSNVGGATCHANVKAMLAKLMTNNLMALFSLAGQGEKHSFRETNLIKLVKDCASASYSEKSIEETIGRILIRAPDRKGGGGRKKKKNGSENGNDKSSSSSHTLENVIAESAQDACETSSYFTSEESDSDDDFSSDSEHF